MPRFSNSGLVRKDNISLQKIDLPEISLGGKSVSYDYHKEMEAMFQGAKEKKEKEGPGLALRDVDMGTMTLALHSFTVGSEWNGLSLMTESEQLLEQAKKLVAQEEFQQALPLLERALQAEFSHEAIYLKAYCLIALNRPEESLVCIAPLRNAILPALLQARVEVLKERIRKSMREILFAELFLHKMLGQIMGGGAASPQQVIGRLQQLVTLDPEVGLYHFLLSSKLLEAGKLEAALQTATRGLQETTTDDRAQLENFHAYLTKLYLQILVRPAIVYMKRQEFQRGRQELGRLAPVYRSDPRLVALDAYLQKLEIRPPRPGRDFPAPTAKPEILQDLYQFMVGEDMDKFEVLMSRGQVGEAENLLRLARQVTPAYPPVNFALASCVYMLGRVEYLVIGANVNKDRLTKRLREVRSYAQVASSLENGSNLLKAVEAFLSRLEEELKVDQVIHGFMSLMEGAQSGIRDLQHCKSIQGQITKLQEHLVGVQSQIQSPDIRNTVSQVAEALESNRSRLQEIEMEIRDADLVNPLWGEYERLMQQIQPGIRSSSQLSQYQAQFQDLQNRAGRVRRELRTDPAREALDQLSQGLGARLKEINSIQTGLEQQERNRAIVEPLIREFNQTMQSLERNKISSRYELDRALENFAQMKLRAEAAQRTVPSQDAKTALSQLISAINDVINQLNRY